MQIQEPKQVADLAQMQLPKRQASGPRLAVELTHCAGPAHQTQRLQAERFANSPQAIAIAVEQEPMAESKPAACVVPPRRVTQLHVWAVPWDEHCWEVRQRAEAAMDAHPAAMLVVHLAYSVPQVW